MCQSQVGRAAVGSAPSFGQLYPPGLGAQPLHTRLRNQREGQMPRGSAPDFGLPEAYTGTGFGCLGPLSSKLN